MNTCSRARTSSGSEGGIVLVAALVLAVLYFGLMELMMIDASRSLTEAQRFRARIVADTLAENAAELAAVQMITKANDMASYQDDQGSMKGTYNRTGDEYVLTGVGRTDGIINQTATVRVQGRIDGVRVLIDYTAHSQ